MEEHNSRKLSCTQWVRNTVSDGEAIDNRRMPRILSLMNLTVEQALQYWQKKKLLTEKKAGELRSALPEEERDSAHRAIRVFSGVGAVLVGLGILLFVASNWGAMTPVFKTALLLIAMLGTGAAGYHLRYEREGYEKTGLALLLVNAFLFGASIFLIGQIYHLPLNFWWGMLLWFAGTAFFAYLLESKLHLWLSVPIFLFFLGWFRQRFSVGFSELDFLFTDRNSLLALLPALGAGMTALAVLHRSHARTSFGETTLFHWGLFLVAFPLLIASAGKEIVFRILFIAPDVVSIGVLIVAIGLLAAAALGGTFLTKEGRGALLALGGFVALISFIIHLPHWMGFFDTASDPFGFTPFPSAPLLSGLFVVFVVLLFVFLLTVVWQGTMLRRPGIINLGIVGLGVAILIQYFSWAFDMLDRSLAFILGGILILLLSALLERQRRRLLHTL